MSIFSRLFARFSQTTTSEPDVAPEWLIIGLGNPGAQYATTRHNVGYMAVDELLRRHGAKLEQVKGMPAQIAHIRCDATPVALLRSTTYMNNSGEAIEPIASAYNVPADHVIVLHDELDLPLGKVRLKCGGNENGHNGLKSTTQLLGTRDYIRVRMGISRPPQGMKVPDYVLGPVDAGEKLDSMIALSADAAEEIIRNGFTKAQNTIHSR